MSDLFNSSSNSEEAWAERIRANEEGNAPPRRSNSGTPKLEKRESTEGEWDTRPLAERMRPQAFEDYLGQEALLGPDAPLMKLINADRIPSMMLWGPPGSGKTTLARLIAQRVNADFVTLSAVSANVRDVRSVIDQAKVNKKFQRRTILFIDEIHRFNKAQQDGFLPHVESGVITLIGATTENPSFSIISPLLSRSRVFVLKPLSEDDQLALLKRGVERLNEERRGEDPELVVEDGALPAIVRMSDGDARRALGLLEVSASVKRAAKDATPLTMEDISHISQRQLIYDKTGEEHYNLISALHKTLRSSDPHAAVYWLTRMLMGGEDPLYLARRLVRFASEDVGMADPFAINHAMECMRAYQSLGSPEGEIALVQLTIYLAMAPKSNSAYKAYNTARAEIGESGTLPVPLHIRNAPTKLMKELEYGKGYTYDHDADEGFIAKQGLPDELLGRKFYEPVNVGKEVAMIERLAKWDAARDAEPKNPPQ
ncbi:replication-associated recombination protein A [soil metagenome]